MGITDPETLLEMYSCDPSWSSKGAALFVAPPALSAGRLVFELDPKACPKAVENFRCLCTGERGVGKGSGKPLHYKGVSFHRIVSGFVCQGGDVVRGDGSGGDSIYGKAFNDEKGGLAKKHTALGTLGMANSGKNSNTSQFYFTLAAPLPKLDGKHVVLGTLVDGKDIVERIDREAASEDGQPKLQVTVLDCGTC